MASGNICSKYWNAMSEFPYQVLLPAGIVPRPRVQKIENSYFVTYPYTTTLTYIKRMSYKGCIVCQLLHWMSAMLDPCHELKDWIQKPDVAKKFDLEYHSENGTSAVRYL